MDARRFYKSIGRCKNLTYNEDEETAVVVVGTRIDFLFSGQRQRLNLTYGYVFDTKSYEVQGVSFEKRVLPYLRAAAISSAAASAYLEQSMAGGLIIPICRRAAANTYFPQTVGEVSVILQLG